MTNVTQTVYFDPPGQRKHHRDARTGLGKELASSAFEIVVASNTGETGLLAAQALPGRRVIVVGSVFGC